MVTNVESKKVKLTLPQKQIAFWSQNYAEKTALERERALQKLSRQLSTESSFKYEQYGHTGKYVDRIYYDNQGNPIEVDEYRGLNQDKID